MRRARATGRLSAADKRYLLLSGGKENEEKRQFSKEKGEKNKELYERSPIHSLDTFDAPYLFLHGSEDPVVPPNQSEQMYEAMVGNIIAASIKIYEGESHGFRKEENIQDALDMNIRDG